MTVHSQDSLNPIKHGEIIIMTFVLHSMVQLLILFLHNIVKSWNILFTQLCEIRWIISQHSEIAKFSTTQHGEIQIPVFYNREKLLKLLHSRENP